VLCPDFALPYGWPLPELTGQFTGTKSGAKLVGYDPTLAALTFSAYRLLTIGRLLSARERQCKSFLIALSKILRREFAKQAVGCRLSDMVEM